MKRILCLTLTMLILCASLVGCGEPKLPPVRGDAITPADYASAENWMHIPDTDYPVDVFYLYPTSWTRAEDAPYVCDIDDATMRTTAPIAYERNATAFETCANVYAPFYRQVDAIWLLSGDLQAGEKYFEGTPYADAVAAFEYYLTHYNNGRPFILAGHSQGSSVIKAMLKYYMAEHPEVYQRMVAAYVVGFSVTEQDLIDYPHLKFAERADDVGVILSWNTEAPGTVDNPLLFEGAISINPITWTREEITAEATQNPGSRIANLQTGEFTLMEHLADATVNKERGSIICASVDIDTYSPPGTPFPRGVYHMQEYGFYYQSIRDNAALRIAAYLEQ